MADPGLYLYRARLVRVYDGDTVFVDVDLGFHVWIHATADPEATEDHGARLARINAPELYVVVDSHRQVNPAGLASANALSGFLEGKALTIRSTRLEKYGRFLVELYADGVNVNDWLVANGWAIPATY